MASREVNVVDSLMRILWDLASSFRFDGAEVEVKREFEVDLKRIDIAVLLRSTGIPVLIIEARRKDRYVTSPGERVRVDPFSRSVVGQALCYATLIKRRFGLPVTPFFATANPSTLVLFSPIEKPEELVDIRKCEEGDYERALSPGAYSALINKYRLYVRRPLRREDVQKVLEYVLRTWINAVRTYKPELLGEELGRFMWPLGYWLIEHLRSQFIDYLDEYFVRGYLRYKLENDKQYYQELDGLAKEVGYRNGLADIVSANLENVERLSRMMLYVLLNKIVFYKVLERHYRDLPPLKPLVPEGVTSASEYIQKLNERFDTAIEVTQDFEAIFRTGLFDRIVLPDEPDCLKTIDSVIELLDSVEVEKLGDVIGHIYEQLIPPEERHQLGQFYTPPPIAELIVKWCLRSPDDRVLDPGVGSGTFLIEAYKRIFELKTGRRYGESYPDEELHERVLSQLYGLDINPFPAQLASMNLAMRNTRVPSRNINILVTDFFAVIPGQSRLAPYTVRTPKGEVRREVSIPRVFDCVVGNPPYTRWIEIPEKTRNLIEYRLKGPIEKYGLLPMITGGARPPIYIYWIMYSTMFLKEGGRLGMIISDSWLQTDYGIRFLKYLLDHFKIRAIIDISSRVFPVPLIGTCIVLLEKCGDKGSRDRNEVIFAYLKVGREGSNVEKILEILERGVEGVHSVGESKIYIRKHTQGDLYGLEDKPISLIFSPIPFMRDPLTKLGELFEVSEGNTEWSVYASRSGRGAGCGGEDFYYISEEKLRSLRIPKQYLKPLIPSPDFLKFFTFREEDWNELRRSGRECYLFLAHKPRSELPKEVQEYIRIGETSIVISKGPNKGKPVSQSSVAKIREKIKDRFYGWWDLGGVIEVPIYVARGTRYWVRFVLADFKCALDDRILALISKDGVIFDEVELKALLAYLNSSFSQLQAEVKGRTAGGVALLELDVKPLSEFLILDVKKLPRENVERLAKLFERLEAEARRLGGADEVENVFGSELVRELAGRQVREGIEGLWNTVIREIDHEIARILGLEEVVESVRMMLLDLVRRRLSRTVARPEAIKGESVYVDIAEKRTKGGRKPHSSPHITLDRFTKKKG